MMKTARYAVVAALGVAAGSCDWFWGYEDVPLYCTQSADCTYAAFPNATYCDVDGAMQGVKNRCVERPVIMCEDASTCTDPGEPICDDMDRVCRACEVGASGDAECADATAGMAEHCLDGACVQCVDGLDCAADTPICDAAAHMCQMCADNTECEARDPNQPICSPAGTCVQCMEHADCASEVCDVDAGTCVDEGGIIYVDGGMGVDGPDCGAKAAPCATIGGAEGGLAKVMEPRVTIKVANGIYVEGVSVTDGKTVVFVGPATVSPSSLPDTPAILITGGSNVTLEQIALNDARGGNDADGLRCLQGSVRLLHAEVFNNDGIGIKASNCTITIERVSVTQNKRGGVSLTDTSFTLQNNLIASNGNPLPGGSTFGGINISNTGPLAVQTLDFNTISGNGSLQTAFATGVICQTVTPMTASNNIVHLNVGGMSNIAGNCAWSYSNIESGASGTGNIDMDPLFVDVDTGNFHLQPDSPCRDAADPAATLGVDFDGDARPQGERHDMGADEIVP